MSAQAATAHVTALNRRLRPFLRPLVVTAVGLIAVNALLAGTSGLAQRNLGLVFIATAFVYSAYKRPPIAIAIVLYFAMKTGGWLILAAAPLTVMLARRYQRMRMQLPGSETHRRRTILMALAAVLATFPFVSASLGAWSGDNRFAPVQSADPLFTPRAAGEEGLLVRLARFLGFGRDPVDSFEVVPGNPLGPKPPEDPFAWWLLLAVVAVLVALVLAWWLWRGRKRTVAAGPVATPARPLARLEAVGARVGRPRAPHEGAITYADALASHTGDRRLAEVGPLVSGHVYQSAFVRPDQVDRDLGGLESSPPPKPPDPPFSLRLRRRLASLPVDGRVVAAAALTAAAIGLAIWLALPHLGDLSPTL